MSNIHLIKDFAKEKGANKGAEFIVKELRESFRKIEELEIRRRLELMYLKDNMERLKKFIDL